MADRAECEAVVSRLWPYLDGALPDAERERVIAHLEECVNCRSHFDFERAFLEAVRAAAPIIDDCDALRERVLAALSEGGLRRS